MKKLIIIIVVLAIIFVGMFLYKSNAIKSKNNVNVQEIEKIETYITKIYMWKEVTGEALPIFENINDAPDIWIWEVVKKNLEDYELTYDQIENEAKTLFGSEFTKSFPKSGTQYIIYDSENDKYYAEGASIDQEEDDFLLNKIEKNGEEYKVEILEYLEDYSDYNNDEIIIKNLNEEEVKRIKTSEESIVKDVVKENIDRFSKKILTIDVDKKSGNYFVKNIKKENLL